MRALLLSLLVSIQSAQASTYYIDASRQTVVVQDGCPGLVYLVHSNGIMETGDMNGTNTREDRVAKNGDSVAITHDGVSHLIRGAYVEGDAGCGGDWLSCSPLPTPTQVNPK